MGTREAPPSVTTIHHPATQLGELEAWCEGRDWGSLSEWNLLREMRVKIQALRCAAGEAP